MSKSVLFGVPFDGNSSGPRGSASAPNVIRETLLHPNANVWTEDGRRVIHLFEDRGDTEYEMLESVSANVARDRPVFLGGDHSITHRIVRGLATEYPNLTIVQIDAHPDLYADFEGDRSSHACPFARILEETLVSRLIQVGIRATTAHQIEQQSRFGVHVLGKDYTMLFDLEGPVYLSLDIDGIDPAFAPGVAHPEPGGLSTLEAVGIIQALRGKIVGADIVEFCPQFDSGQATARVAAKLLKETIGALIPYHPQ